VGGDYATSRNRLSFSFQIIQISDVLSSREMDCYDVLPTLTLVLPGQCTQH
jgi:hypothetical protein